MAFQLFNSDIGGSAIGQGIEKLGVGIATGEEKDKMVSSRAKQYEKLVQTMNESFGDKSPFKDVDLHGMNRYDMANAFADSHTMIDSFSKFQEQQAQAQYRTSEAARQQALTENMKLQNEGIKKLLAGGETQEPKFNTPAAAALYKKNKQVVQAKEDAAKLGVDVTPYLQASQIIQAYHEKSNKSAEATAGQQVSAPSALDWTDAQTPEWFRKTLAGASLENALTKKQFAEPSEAEQQQVDSATKLLSGLNNNPELKAVVAPIIHDHFNSNPVTASSFTQSTQPQIKRIGPVVVDNKKK